MFDRNSVRLLIERWLEERGSRSVLNELSDLGAVHFGVLQMLSEMIVRLSEAGYSKADIHLALSEDVVLARYAAHSPEADQDKRNGERATGRADEPGTKGSICRSGPDAPHSRGQHSAH